MVFVSKNKHELHFRGTFCLCASVFVTCLLRILRVNIPLTNAPIWACKRVGFAIGWKLPITFSFRETVYIGCHVLYTSPAARALFQRSTVQEQSKEIVSHWRGCWERRNWGKLSSFFLSSCTISVSLLTALPVIFSIFLCLQPHSVFQ